MECDKIRKENPHIIFPECCDSCHEDEATGFGDDLWFIINGVDRHVCCAIAKAIKDNH